jgi:hypothetical protein
MKQLKLFNDNKYGYIGSEFNKMIEKSRKSLKEEGGTSSDEVKKLLHIYIVKNRTGGTGPT